MSNLKTRDQGRQAPGRRRRGRPAKGEADDTRSALLRAARKLLQESGASYVSVQRIAHEAAVDPAMVNYHFGGRDQLFSAVLNQAIEEWLPRAQEIADRSGDALARLEQRLRGLVAMRREAPFIDRLLLEQIIIARGSDAETRFRAYLGRALKQYETLVADGVEQGTLKPIDPAFLFVSSLALCEYFFAFRKMLDYVLEIDGDDPEVVERYADHVVELILHGVARRPDGGSADSA
jgi:AcrR family transcriptional regulator